MASIFFIFIRVVMVLAIVATGPITMAQDSDHEDGDHQDSDAATNVVLTIQQQKKNGVVVATARKRSVKERITAPGEVVLNAYSSSEVTPRIASHALARYALLGEEVHKGQPLARLSSIEMAEAQGDLLIAAGEWRRVQKLGRQTVSGRRYTEAEVVLQQAMAKAKTYGMTQSQVTEFLKNNDASQATGAYDLLSPQNGTVISDNFLVGERIEPGQVLFELTDESSMWIEARLAAYKALEISKQTSVRISNDGVHWIDGQILQIHHSLDEQTRTRIVRIEVDNRHDSLHPGEFVEVEFLAGPGEVVLAVPASSIVVLEESSVVFRRMHGDEFNAQPIEVGTISGNWVEVRAGLSEGDEIVVGGAFGLKSEFLKSERGEGHSH
jgi:cobalt-zinc-cadmium efflux system membrane fusion protein